MTGRMAAVRSPVGDQVAVRSQGGQEAIRSPDGLVAVRGQEEAGVSPGILAGVASRGTLQNGKCVGLMKGVIEYPIALTYTPWRIFPHF